MLEHIGLFMMSAFYGVPGFGRSLWAELQQLSKEPDMKAIIESGLLAGDIFGWPVCHLVQSSSGNVCLVDKAFRRVGEARGLLKSLFGGQNPGDPFPL
jgi:hypothetical protein